MSLVALLIPLSISPRLHVLCSLSMQPGNYPARQKNCEQSRITCPRGDSLTEMLTVHTGHQRIWGSCQSSLWKSSIPALYSSLNNTPHTVSSTTVVNIMTMAHYPQQMRELELASTARGNRNFFNPSYIFTPRDYPSRWPWGGRPKAGHSGQTHMLRDMHIPQGTYIPTLFIVSLYILVHGHRSVSSGGNARKCTQGWIRE